MLGPDLRISLADLGAAGVRLRPAESVTIVRAIAQDVARGTLPGVPSAHVIRFAGDGGITVEGPVAAGGRTVQRAALLLDTLLPAFDAPPELRAPGALRLVVARGVGTIDLPPYGSLEEFTDALGRFAGADATAVVIDLVKSWAAAHSQVAAPAPEPRAETVERAEERRRRTAAGTGLTISDIRRARRATRLTLLDVSERTRIPVPLLRELEWGYFDRWPSGHYGRTQLVRYARASGLDDQVVVRTVWPLIEEHVRTEPAELTPASAPDVEVAELQLVPAHTGLPVPIGRAERAPRAPRRRWLAALAIPALIALGVVPAYWSVGPEPTQQQAQSEPEPASALRENAAALPAERGPSTTPATSNRTDRAMPPPPTAQPARETVATTGMGAPRPAIAGRQDEAYSPSFASEGSAMFYHSDGALMRADTDSGGAVLRVTRVVDDRSRNFHARPSPDGSLIAFDSDREGDRAVYVASARGTNVRRISGEGFAAIPSWSPDGRTLAFVRAEPDRPRVWNLWTADLESGALTRLTSHRVGQPWGASWFPDGRRIAYSHETRLVVRDLETGRERAYASPIKGRLVRTPAVSPDGRRVIFQVYRDGAWLLDLGSGAMRRVLADPGAEEYSWSPDGRRVAYHSRRSGEWGVWIMAAR